MEPLKQRIRFCTSLDGTKIAYAVCGKGPPLLWAGSFMRHLELDGSSPIWAPWLAMLSKRHTLIRFDWRGCGLSDRKAGEYTMQRYAEDLMAVIEANQLKRFALFGHEGSGTLAIMATLALANAVSHLILLNCRGTACAPT